MIHDLLIARILATQGLLQSERGPVNESERVNDSERGL